jgi:hypothetical protein
MVFASVANAERHLLQIDNPSLVTAIVAALADTARELAQIAIDQAVLANVNPQQIAAAQQLIQQGGRKHREWRLRGRDPVLSARMAAYLVAVTPGRVRA